MKFCRQCSLLRMASIGQGLSGTTNQISSPMQPELRVSMPHVVTNGYSACSTAQYMAPPVVLDRFDGNILKYPAFKWKFLKFVESVC